MSDANQRRNELNRDKPKPAVQFETKTLSGFYVVVTIVWSLGFVAGLFVGHSM